MILTSQFFSPRVEIFLLNPNYSPLRTHKIFFLFEVIYQFFIKLLRISLNLHREIQMQIMLKKLKNSIYAHSRNSK